MEGEQTDRPTDTQGKLASKESDRTGQNRRRGRCRGKDKGKGKGRRALW